MNDLNITIEQYIQLEEEKACRRAQVYNWETATYGKIWYDEDVHYLRSFEKKFLAIVYKDALTSEQGISSEPMCEINRAAGGKLQNKNSDESWEIIENFALYNHEGPSPQPKALGTTFEARVRDYMVAHSERMERFRNAIFKQHEEINGRMTEMFGLLKELTTSRAPEKVLIMEEAKFLVTKNVNSISLARGEKEMCDKTDETLENTKNPTVTERKEVLSSRPVKGKTYNVLPRGPVFEEILKKKITKKDVEGNFKIPCIIGGLKHVNALVDQGSDVNVMPYSTYMKLTNEMRAETDIRLSLASHSYIYSLGIAEDVLVEVAEHVYPVDFVILDIKENEKRPFILGTPFLTMAKATIKFDKGTITLRSVKSKISSIGHLIPPASPGMGRKDKASLGKGDRVQPIEEQKFQRKVPHSYYNQGRNGR
ncbi:zinc finger, CCHC-type containing protein [Tanacetum coccineum]